VCVRACVPREFGMWLFCMHRLSYAYAEIVLRVCIDSLTRMHRFSYAYASILLRVCIDSLTRMQIVVLGTAVPVLGFGFTWFRLCAQRERENATWWYKHTWI
jgi:hypothetical protein